MFKNALQKKCQPYFLCAPKSVWRLMANCTIKKTNEKKKKETSGTNWAEVLHT